MTKLTDLIDKEQFDEEDHPKHPDEMTFTELLAVAANEDKTSLAHATLKAFKEGESGAIKLVQQALLEHQYGEENKFPISDERFKQIIEVAATAISQGEI